jgi:tRNA A-37 threonylcarbamoyl transferase component Bud32
MMDLSKPIAVRPKKKIYRDGDRVIKVMDEDYSAPDVLREAFNLSVVRETGFRVPALYEVLKIDGKWALVMEHIEGKTLDDMIKENPKNAEAYFNRMVDIQLDMHKCKAHRLWRHTDKMQDKINESGLDETTRYELHTRLSGLPKHDKLCHGDFVPINIIITPDDKPCVIDWFHATQGNASADAARTFLCLMLAGNEKHAEIYMRLFCEKSKTARRYVETWMSIVAASQLVKHKPEEKDFLMRWAHVVEYD